MLIRYADDFVCAVQCHRDAEHFYRTLLPERLDRFGLELAPDKTRHVRFSSFGGDKNERFQFLGYEFRQGLNRHLKPQVKRRTSRSRQRRAMNDLTEWIKRNRHTRLRPLPHRSHQTSYQEKERPRHEYHQMGMESCDLIVHCFSCRLRLEERILLTD